MRGMTDSKVGVVGTGGTGTIGDSTSGYIGITENRMKHIVGVANRCYEIAKRKDMSEDDCRKAFMMGYLHDVGYAFSEKVVDHPKVSYDLMLNAFGVAVDELKNHGSIEEEQEGFLAILNEADLTVDSDGTRVTVEKRISGIKHRCGDYFKNYGKMTAIELARKLGLIGE